MTISEFETLTAGTNLLHERYGPIAVLCMYPGWGFSFEPLTDFGKKILYRDNQPAFFPIDHCYKIQRITAESVANFDPK